MTIDAAALAAHVTRETSLPFSGRAVTAPGGEFHFVLTPEGYHAAQTFQLGVRSDWRALEATFEQGAYSAELVSAMGRADESGRESFMAILDVCVAEGATFTMRVNGSIMGHREPRIWDEIWRTFGFTLRKGQLPLGARENMEDAALVVRWASRAAAAVVTLLPLEEVTAQVPADEPALPEGALTRVQVNRYERDRRNRAAALAIHGFACKACGIVLADRYGAAASDYIEVHHLTPISKLGPGYLIDPRTDLVPLCPNCHGVAHQRTPPYSLEELRSMLNASPREERMFQK